MSANEASPFSVPPQLPLPYDMGVGPDFVDCSMLTDAQERAVQQMLDSGFFPRGTDASMIQVDGLCAFFPHAAAIIDEKVLSVLQMAISKGCKIKRSPKPAASTQSTALGLAASSSGSGLIEAVLGKIGHSDETFMATDTPFTDMNTSFTATDTPFTVMDTPGVAKNEILASEAFTKSTIPNPTRKLSDGCLAHPVGLRNIASTCYLNALLQVLFSSSAFRRMVIETAPRDGVGLSDAEIKRKERELEENEELVFKLQRQVRPVNAALGGRSANIQTWTSSQAQLTVATAALQVALNQSSGVTDECKKALLKQLRTLCPKMWRKNIQGPIFVNTLIRPRPPFSVVQHQESRVGEGADTLVSMKRGYKDEFSMSSEDDLSDLIPPSRQPAMMAASYLKQVKLVLAGLHFRYAEDLPEFVRVLRRDLESRQRTVRMLMKQLDRDRMIRKYKHVYERFQELFMYMQHSHRSFVVPRLFVDAYINAFLKRPGRQQDADEFRRDIAQIFEAVASDPTQSPHPPHTHPLPALPLRPPLPTHPLYPDSPHTLFPSIDISTDETDKPVKNQLDSFDPSSVTSLLSTVTKTSLPVTTNQTTVTNPSMTVTNPCSSVTAPRTAVSSTSIPSLGTMISPVTTENATTVTTPSMRVMTIPTRTVTTPAMTVTTSVTAPSKTVRPVVTASLAATFTVPPTAVTTAVTKPTVAVTAPPVQASSASKKVTSSVTESVASSVTDLVTESASKMVTTPLNEMFHICTRPRFARLRVDGSVGEVTRRGRRETHSALKVHFNCEDGKNDKNKNQNEIDKNCQNLNKNENSNNNGNNLDSICFPELELDEHECSVYRALTTHTRWTALEKPTEDAFTHCRTELTRLPPILFFQMMCYDSQRRIVREALRVQTVLYLDEHATSSKCDSGTTASTTDVLDYQKSIDSLRSRLRELRRVQKDLQNTQKSIRNALKSSTILADNFATAMPPHLKRPTALLDTPTLTPSSVTSLHSSEGLESTSPPLKKRAVSSALEGCVWVPTLHDEWMTNTKRYLSALEDQLARVTDEQRDAIEKIRQLQEKHCVHVYDLHAAIIHTSWGSDNTDSGHYYAYIRHPVSSADTSSTSRHKWFKFDDHRVTEADFKDVVKDARGGHGANRSAYMLVYFRRDDNEDDKSADEPILSKAKEQSGCEEGGDDDCGGAAATTNDQMTKIMSDIQADNLLLETQEPLI